jgi:2-polyprenyl-6-methoxyphenol hydroxylase-like FAD-dependent oxidoreductase
MTAIDKALIVGGGVGGLTAAIGLRRIGVSVDVLEINPAWSVYGVGIVQQANVVRAMASLGLLDRYRAASFGFDHVRIHDKAGRLLNDMPVPHLAGTDYPAALGIARPALHDVLGAYAQELGVRILTGVTVDRLEQDTASVAVTCSDGTRDVYDLVIAADGLHSRVRALAFPDAPKPRYTGQVVWRHDFPRAPEVDCLFMYIGADGNAGICPLSDSAMYLYVSSNEPEGFAPKKAEVPALMRARLESYGGAIAPLREKISDPAGVYYKAIETILVPAPWYRGRVLLLGDAAHTTSPHLGQGAGIAVEDAVVLAELLEQSESLSTALARFMERRWERCRFIVETSLQMGEWEREGRKDADRVALLRRMYEITSRPI